MAVVMVKFSLVAVVMCDSVVLPSTSVATLHFFRYFLGKPILSDL